MLGGSGAEAGVGNVVNRSPLTRLPCPQRPVCTRAVTIQRNSSEGLGAALLPLLVETDVSVPSPNIEVAWQIFFFLAENIVGSA